MNAENYYDILGLKRGAGDEQVKQAFRDLAKNLHPDRNPGDAEAERQFKLVNTAYEALKDGSRRRAYDEWLTFARKTERSRVAQWGRLAALVAVLLLGPSLALYWALMFLEVPGLSPDRAALPPPVNTQALPRPAAPVSNREIDTKSNAAAPPPAAQASRQPPAVKPQLPIPVAKSEPPAAAPSPPVSATKPETPPPAIQPESPAPVARSETPPPLRRPEYLPPSFKPEAPAPAAASKPDRPPPAVRAEPPLAVTKADPPSLVAPAPVAVDPPAPVRQADPPAPVIPTPARPADPVLVAPAPVRPADPPVLVPPAPVRQADPPAPVKPPEATGSTASRAADPEDAETRQSLRDLAGAEDREDAAARGETAAPREAPAIAPPVDRRGPVITPRVPVQAPRESAARSMARMIAQFKEPKVAAYANEPAPERNQRQAALEPELQPLPRRPSNPAGPDDFVDCSLCPVMSVVTATDLLARPGSDPSVRGTRPIRTLAISKFEVTFGEWNACVQEGACRGSRAQGPGEANKPVQDVTRTEAAEYAEWLSRKTGKVYRPMKPGGWNRSVSSRRDTGGNGAAQGQEPEMGAGSNAGQPTRRGRSGCAPAQRANGQGWEWLDDADCARPGQRSEQRSSERSGTGPRATSQAEPLQENSGFWVARSLRPDGS